MKALQPRQPRMLTVLTLAFLLPTAALAHPGHDGLNSTFAAGLLHPLTGPDHVLMIVAVGAWAAQFRTTGRAVVCAALMGFVTLGALLAPVGVQGQLLEGAIALTVVGSGMLLALGRKLPLAGAASLAAVFALVHGFAHGLEGPAETLGYVPGLALSTGLLGAGAAVIAGWLAAGGNARWLRRAGALSALSGAVLLLG